MAKKEESEVMLLMEFYERLGITSETAIIIISVAMMLFFGFLMTRVTKLLKLPNVTAYIITGIVMGPFCLNLVPQFVIDGTDFISDIALAFIAFGVGEFFKLSTLKKNGMKVVVITLFESLTASVVVFILTFFVLRLDFAFSVVLAALASATAPASTLMTIRQTGAKGDFVETLLQAVALDDVVSLVAYSIAISVAIAVSMGQAGNFSAMTVITPILTNVGVMVLGGLFGFALKFLMPKRRTTDNRLIILLSVLFVFCGICIILDVSPLLGCMMMGMVYINCTDDDKLFKQLNYFAPPILLLFFVRSGMNFKIDTLFSTTGSVGSVSLITVGVLYFAVRIIGKYSGAFLGCLFTKKEKRVRNYLGLALIPQAGVAIGLAALGARTLGGEIGDNLQTIILASSVLYEMVGPGCAKLALYFSHSYSNNIEEITTVDTVKESGEQKSEVEILIERIQAIQKGLPKPEKHTYSEEEQAFMEAAEEQYEALSEMHRSRFKKRK